MPRLGVGWEVRKLVQPCDGKQWDPTRWTPCLSQPCNYLLNEGSLVGPAFKEPFIGPFTQSFGPKFVE